MSILSLDQAIFTSLYDVDLKSQYKDASAQLINTLNANFSSLPGYVNLELAPDLEEDILYFPEKWAPNRRLFQTSIEVNHSTKKSDRFIFDHINEHLHLLKANIKKSNLSKEEKAYYFLFIDLYQQLNNEIIRAYKYQFLQSLHEKLREKIYSFNNTNSIFQEIYSLKINEDTTPTRHDAIKLHGKIYSLYNASKKELCTNVEKLKHLELYRVVSNLIIDEYYFNPINLSQVDVAREILKILSMIIAILASLAVIILSLIILCSPAAPVVLITAAFVISFIGMIAYWPVIDNLFDLIRCAWYRRAPSSSKMDIFLNVVLPLILIPIVTSTLVINLHPIADGIKFSAAKFFELFGTYGLCTIGFLANSYFSYLQSMFIFGRSSPQTLKHLNNYQKPDLKLETAIKVLNKNQDKKNKFNIENKMMSGSVTSFKSTSNLFYVYQTASEYKIKESKTEALKKALSITFFTSPFKSEIYKKLEKQVNDYMALKTTTDLKIRIEKLNEIKTTCQQWCDSHFTRTSLRKTRVELIKAQIEFEIDNLNNISKEIPLGASLPSPMFLLCRIS